MSLELQIVAITVIVALTLLACRAVRLNRLGVAFALLTGATIILGATVADGRPWTIIDWVAVIAVWSLPAIALYNRRRKPASHKHQGK